jgi:PAS domain S-box-containing protein
MLIQDQQTLERQVAEQLNLLRESRERFRLFMESGPVLAWAKDREGRFLYANAKVGQLLGVNAGDLIGKRQSELLEPRELEIVSANDLLVIETQQARQFEERVTDTSGKVCDWLVYKFPLPGEDGQTLCGGMAVDITERNELHAKNRASDLKVRAVYDSAFQFIGLLDPEGILLDANATALSFIDVPLEQVTGKPFWETPWWTASAEEQARCREAVQRAAAGETVRMVTHHRSAEGQCIDIDFSLKPLRDGSGKITHLIPEGRDITDMTRMQQEATAARETADAANRAKSEFLANMSHEIRTPLTAILGFSKLLQKPDCPAADQREYASIICRSAGSLMDLVNDILDLSKIEAGKMSAEMRDCEVMQLICEVMETLRPRAEEKGLSFDVTFSDAIPERIRTDEGKLRQILMNLIGNAIKFTDGGFVSVQIGYTGLATGGRLAVLVKDSGIGIPGQKLEKLFQSFSQADESTTRRFGGTGLGLVISRRLARLLGGDIDVKSEPGVGSVFTISVDCAALPVAQAEERGFENAAVAAVHAERAGEVRLKGRILLAEDGRDNQRLITAILQEAGAEVVLAVNGRVAVELASAEEFDLILMDIQMPEMDGHTATRELRSRGFSRPIVALTAHAMAEDRAKCMACGCTDYLTKPIDLAMFLQTVAKHLGTGTGSMVNLEKPGAIGERVIGLKNDSAGLAKLKEAFITGLPEEVSRLRRLMQSADSVSLGRAAHQLRGDAGGYGFEEIMRRAALVEDAIRADGNRDSVAVQVQKLIDVLQNVQGFEGEPRAGGVMGGRV